MNNSWDRKVEIGDCVLYQGDCLKIMPMLDGVDALVCDPPYGIGEARSGNASRGKLATSRDYGHSTWDNSTADEAVDMAVKMAKWSIVFGGNYYDMPPTSCWLIWDKVNGKTDFSDCEMAWTNLPKAVRQLRFMWNGMLRSHGESRGDHPTQKPVGVMKWCVEHLPSPHNQTILDPFMGSGTTGVACAKLGRKFVGIELDATYFNIACERIRKAYEQPDMFVEVQKPALAEQFDMLKLDDN